MDNERDQGMSYTRREFLRRLGLTAGAVPLATALTACDETMGEENNLPEEEMPLELPTYSYEGEQGPEGLFSHGVASGDPLSDAVILWTRVSPTDPDSEVEIFWEMGTDPELTELVAAGYLTTSGSRRSRACCSQARRRSGCSWRCSGATRAST